MDSSVLDSCRFALTPEGELLVASGPVYAPSGIPRLRCQAAGANRCSVLVSTSLAYAGSGSVRCAINFSTSSISRR